VLERLVGANRIPAHHHRQRLLDPDHPRKPLGAPGARQQSELHLRESEARVLDGDAIVTRQRDLETAAERRSVDGRDDGLRAVLDELQHHVQARRRRRLAELRDVGAGDERAARAGDDDRAHRLIGDGLLESLVEAVPDVLAQRVDGGVVDGEHGHATAAVEIDGLGNGCHGVPPEETAATIPPDAPAVRRRAAFHAGSAPATLRRSSRHPRRHPVRSIAAKYTAEP
jgi:hypothetical protein